MKRILVAIGVFFLCIPLVAQQTQSNQAADLKAFFRDGQTFLTWREATGENTQYRIYRSTSPISSIEGLTSDSLVAQVGDYTSLNLMASINRMALSNTRGMYKIPERKYYVIEEEKAPLSDDTGLFVSTARKDEVAHYAVTAVTDGNENRTAGSNVLKTGIEEKIQAISPVKQNDEVDYVHWTDNVGNAQYPAMSPQPSTAYNFCVHASDGEDLALIGILHGALFQYNTPEKDRYAKLDSPEEEGAVRVSLDNPLMRGRIEGIQVPDTRSAITSGGMSSGRPRGWAGADKRILWTLDWVASKYPVDKNRISLKGESMGGIGSLHMALMYPDYFSAINAYVPVVTGSMGGPGDVNPPLFVLSNMKQSVPFIMMTAGRADNIVGWREKLKFSSVMELAQQGFALYWDARQHAYAEVEKYPPVWNEPNGRQTHLLTSFSLKQSYPAISDLSAMDDPGIVNLATRPVDRPALDSPGVGDLVGTINGQVDWETDSIVDESDRYEMTLKLNEYAEVDSATMSITPRRLQNFRPESGQSVRYVFEEGEKSLKEGVVRVDQNGLMQIAWAPVTKNGVRMKLSRGSREFTGR